MQNLIRALAALLLVCTAVTAGAAPMQAFEFDDPEQEVVFKRLSHEIRCLVCQNQAIGDSNADLAKDLRQQIYEMLQQGKSEQQIVDFLVQRYGDFVLYNPPVKPTTWLLWFGPALLFFIALFFVYRFVMTHRSTDVGPVIDDDDLQRLKELQDEARHENKDSSAGDSETR